jgi:hypothetical protein
MFSAVCLMGGGMITRSRAGLILIIVGIALTPLSSASALDGEVLIDQRKAGTGGITPGDAPGFPITISRGGKYKLTSNLNVTAGKNAFNITGHNVTLDLNGFRIVGGQFGINAVAVDGLTVMNGTIVNFSSDGIRARGFAIIQDVQITNNGGMGVKLNNNGRVLGSTISGNNGVNIYCVSRCLIASNVVSDSKTESGIGLFTNAGGHLVLGNVISNNTVFAIYAEGTTGFANNTVTGNGTFNNSSIIGPVSGMHPNYCDPACP